MLRRLAFAACGTCAELVVLMHAAFRVLECTFIRMDEQNTDWACISIIVEDGWEEAVSEENGWPYVEEEYEWTKQKMSNFLYHLAESRGEFGRLLLLMAEVERLEHGDNGPRWYRQEDLRERMK